jgi:hypothetical protein
LFVIDKGPREERRQRNDDGEVNGGLEIVGVKRPAVVPQTCGSTSRVQLGDEGGSARASRFSGFASVQVLRLRSAARLRIAIFHVW